MIDSLRVLDLITNDDEFFKMLLQRNPSLESDLANFKLNPSCSCKSNIQQYLENTPSEHEFINNWLDKIETTSLIFNMSKETLNKLKSERFRMALKPSLPQSEWKNFKDVIGEYVEIEPNPDKYKELIAIAREKWFYNGLNVLETLKTNPEDGSEKVVWIVFFY